ncbi:MAG: hypothetical protein MZU97_00405 [Bacillus subtilis]|nr:hypothetical protein [Bacillus subtilis]
MQSNGSASASQTPKRRRHGSRQAEEQEKHNQRRIGFLLNEASRRNVASKESVYSVMSEFFEHRASRAAVKASLAF